MSPLFEPLAIALGNDGEAGPASIAVTGYVDSFDDHVDGAYLKAQVALEAICRGMVASKGSSVLVTCPKEWLKFVGGIAEAIRPFARDEEAATNLIHKVESAMHAPSTDAVPAAFQVLGIVVPPEAIAEIKRRNTSAHEFVMSHSRHWDLDEDVRRLRIVQTLLAAVVARTVGYGGPICGWDRGDLGEPVEVRWWPDSDVDTEKAIPAFDCEDVG